MSFTVRRALGVLAILAVMVLTTPTPSALAGNNLYDVNIAPVGPLIKVTTHEGFVIYLQSMTAWADAPLTIYDSSNGTVVMESKRVFFKSDGNGAIDITDMTSQSAVAAGKKNICGFNMGPGTATSGNINT